MKWLVIGILVVVGVIASGRTPWYLAKQTIQIKGETFMVERAVTNEQRRRGLMYRDTLSTNQGMLLEYESEATRAIWMRNMRFAIDALWLSADDAIVDIAQALRPELDEHTGVQPAQYVLELPAGTVDRIGITIGDVVDM